MSDFWYYLALRFCVSVLPLLLLAFAAALLDRFRRAP